MTPEPLWHDSAYYQLKVKGVFGIKWSAWFEDMTIEARDSETVLTGKVADQAALHGLLVRVRDLGLTLISVTRIESE
jgi:hypothetical protein